MEESPWRLKTLFLSSSIWIINQLFLWVNFCLLFLLLLNSLRFCSCSIRAFAVAKDCNYLHSISSFWPSLLPKKNLFLLSSLLCSLLQTFHLCDIIFLQKLKEILDDWEEYFGKQKLCKLLLCLTKTLQKIALLRSITIQHRLLPADALHLFNYFGFNEMRFLIHFNDSLPTLRNHNLKLRDKWENLKSFRCKNHCRQFSPLTRVTTTRLMIRLLHVKRDNICLLFFPSFHVSLITNGDT